VAKPASRVVTAYTPNPNFASQYLVNVYDTNQQFVCSGLVQTDNFGSGEFVSFIPLSGYYDVFVKGLHHLEHHIENTFVDTGENMLIDAFSGRQNRPLGISKDDILIHTLFYTQIAGPTINNLSIYPVYPV